MLWKRILVNSLIGVIIGGLLLVANNTQFMEKIELSLYDLRFENFRGLRPPAEDFLILKIDEASFEEMGPFPWNRNVYVDVINKLKKYGAKYVAMDILFATPSPSQDADKALEKVLKENKDLVSVVSVFEFGNTARTTGSGEGQVVNSVSYSPPYFENDVSFGFANVMEDVDGQVRKLQLLQNIKVHDLLPTNMTINETFEPHFILKTLQKLNPEKTQQAIAKYGDSPFWINFAGPPKSYDMLSYFTIYKLGREFNREQFTQLVGKRPEDVFKDKIVLIGMTAEIAQDTHHTPFATTENTKMAGVEVLANALDTLRQDIPYQPVEPRVNTILAIGLALATGLILSFLGPLGGLAAILALAALYSVVNIYYFHLHRLFIDWFAPLVAIGVTYTAVFAYRFLIEEREKRRIRRFFKSYVSPQLVEELLKNPDTMPTLKSERKMVSILFSDIAGFTSMSETLPPDEVEHILNEYLTAMTKIVFENEGTLDKYIGDAVMAIWGNVGPNNPKTDAYKAVNTGIQMQKTLAELREKWLAEGMVPLQIRIGIHTGEALVGNFGSPQKMDYTVIGDTVNTASRLEGLNKEYSTSILISQSTCDLVSDRVQTRACGAAKVKGKEESVTVYEVLGWKEDSAAATEARETKWIKSTTETQWQ